jgi:hypothetical protein
MIPPSYTKTSSNFDWALSEVSLVLRLVGKHFMPSHVGGKMVKYGVL